VRQPTRRLEWCCHRHGVELAGRVDAALVRSRLVSTGSNLLVIGGRSGVGKSTVAFALHAQLAAERVRHAVIEGDALDLAWPAPWEHRLAERNLAAVWVNYRALGYDLLVYTNTMSVLHAGELAAAMGDYPVVTAILLTADDSTARARLARREHGDSLAAHVQRSDAAARVLQEMTPLDVHRLSTDGRDAVHIAREVRGLWLG
jgi:ABC-type glutathione transport system ATPase component